MKTRLAPHFVGCAIATINRYSRSALMSVATIAFIGFSQTTNAQAQSRQTPAQKFQQMDALSRKICGQTILKTLEEYRVKRSAWEACDAIRRQDDLLAIIAKMSKFEKDRACVKTLLKCTGRYGKQEIVINNIENPLASGGLKKVCMAADETYGSFLYHENTEKIGQARDLANPTVRKAMNACRDSLVADVEKSPIKKYLRDQYEDDLNDKIYAGICERFATSNVVDIDILNTPSTVHTEQVAKDAKKQALVMKGASPEVAKVLKVVLENPDNRICFPHDNDGKPFPFDSEGNPTGARKE